MGIRETQYYGLNKKAKKFLEKKGIKEHVELVIDKKIEKEWDRLKTKEYDNERGMFDEKVPLHMYYLKDGKKMREKVQATPWSSGMCIFTCLENEDGERLFEWTEEEMNKVI